ncbi:MAG TPA: trigger factor [Terriglobales bacterium]|nr:trigger factor [Terriglobales bacterium]
MTVTETQNNCTREIEVEIPADVVARETSVVLERFQKHARLPGFRKGKVPPSVLRQRFPEDIRSEVVEALIPRYFRQEVEKRGLQPLSQPRVSDLHLADGEALRFKASFEIMPEIQVAGYEELRAERTDTSVTDQEVEEALGRLREQQATYNAVDDRELRDGDFAKVSLVGTPQAGEGKPVTMDDVMVEIGGATTVRDFSDNLRGARPGEERRFDVTYPEDFSDQRLAGKKLAYAITINAIKQKMLPELNDDFAKSAGEFQSLEELRAKVREQLEAEKKHAAEHTAKDKLVDELVRRNDFPIPEALVDRQVDVRLERGLRALAAQGMRTEDMKKMDFSRLRAGQREAAVREVKAGLLLEKIADLEKISVSDEEIEQEVAALAKQMQQTPESVRARLTRDGALDRIRNRIRNEKTLDFLYRRLA